jgi:hypothetical protein
MAKFKVMWSGPPSPENNGIVSYQLKHQPSVSIPLSDGWYGTKVSGGAVDGSMFQETGRLGLLLPY